MSDFDSRHYGYTRLSDLVAATGAFEVQRKYQHVRIRSKKEEG